MLFLAVFCGFLAEYQLEHKIENDRAKELAKSLFAELTQDSIRLDKLVALRSERAKCTEYLMQFFRNADLSKPSDTAFRYMAFSYLTVSNKLYFEPSEGILTQLQNSGSRRYFKTQEIQNAISSLTSSINFVKLRNERELTFVTTYCRPFCLDHLNYFWLNEYMEQGNLSIIEAFQKNKTVSTVIPIIQKGETLDREKAVNIAGNLLLMNRGMMNSTIAEYRKSASALMQILRRDFSRSIIQQSSN